MVVHFPELTNKYGMLAGFSVAIILRALSGEPVLKYNAFLKFPGYVEPDQSDVSAEWCNFFSSDYIIWIS